MSEFKQKLRFLLNRKYTNDEILFNASLLKIHKKIKRQNSSKLFIPSFIQKRENKSNLEKSNLKKYTFGKIKKSNPSNNYQNIINSFSFHDFHLNNNKHKKNNKLFTNIHDNKKENYELNKKICYFGSNIKNYFGIYMNRIKKENGKYLSNKIIYDTFSKYKENIYRNNADKTTIHKKNDIQNYFRTGNKFFYNYNRHKSFLLKHSIKNILLDNSLKI